MSDTFRDAISEEINGLAVGSGYYTAKIAWDEAREAGANILAMPQMQAIKAYLLQDVDGPYSMNRQAEWLARGGLPASVIDWVLGGAT